MSITQANKTTYASSSSLTTHTNTFGWTATKRNLLVACITSASTFNLTTGWTRVANPTDFAETDIWYKVADGTETALAVTCTGATTACLIGVTEWSGDTGLIWALDRSVSANNTATTAQPGTTAATRSLDELAIYAFGNGGGGASAYTGTTTGGITTEFNGSDAGSTNHLLYASEILSAIGTVTATATSSASSHHSSVIATFRMMPPTLIAVCGAECGLAAIGGTTTGVRHWSTVTGTPTVETTHPFDSERAYRFNASGTPVNLTHTFGAAIASPGTQVTRFKIYFNGSLPSNDCYFVTALGLPSFQYDAGTGQIGCGGTLGTLQLAGPTVAANTVYEVEYSITRDTAIGTRYKLTVNGTDYGTFTGSGISAGGTTYVIGVITNTITADVYIDDIVVSGTAADYPIGPGIVAGLYPNGDGTHEATWASGAFGKGAGGATAAARTDTDIWQSLANPLSATIGTNFVADKTPVAITEFVEFTLEDLPAAATRVNGAMVVATTHSAASTANTFYLGVRIIGGGASDFSAVWNSVDFSETTLMTVCSMRNVDASFSLSPWTVAAINSNGFRFASTDTNPDVYLDGAMMEVDYVAAGDATATTQSLGITVTVNPVLNPDATGNAGVVTATVTRNALTGGASGTTSALSRTVTTNGLTAGAGGTTAALARTTTVGTLAGGSANTVAVVTPTVTVPQATGSGSTPDATGNAGVVTVTVTTNGLTGSASGVTQAVAPTVTVNAPTGTAAGTTVALSRIVTVNTPTAGAGATTTALSRTVTTNALTGGAGGTTVALPVNVTINPVVQPSATANAGVVAVTVTSNTMLGGAAGTTGSLPVNVTVNAPSATSGATAATQQLAVTATTNTVTGGAAGTTTSLPVNVTVNQVVQPSATANAGVVAVAVTANGLTGGAAGTTTALSRTVTVNAAGAGGGATPAPVQPAVSTGLLTGGAGGTTQSQSHAVTVNGATGGANATATPNPVTVSAMVNGLTGSAGGTTGSLSRTVTVLQASAAGSATASPQPVTVTVTRNTLSGGAGGVTAALTAVVSVLPLPSAGGGLAGVVSVSVSTGGLTGGASGTVSAAAAVTTVLQPSGRAGATTQALAVSVAAPSPAGSAGGSTAALARTVTVPQPTAVGESVALAGAVSVAVSTGLLRGSAGGTTTALVVPVVMLAARGFGLAPPVLGGGTISLDDRPAGTIGLGEHGSGGTVSSEPVGAAGAVTVGR